MYHIKLQTKKLVFILIFRYKYLDYFQSVLVGDAVMSTMTFSLIMWRWRVSRGSTCCDDNKKPKAVDLSLFIYLVLTVHIFR